MTSRRWRPRYNCRAEPSRAEPSRAEPSRAEPSRAEPSRAEPSRAEPSRAVSALGRAQSERFAWLVAWLGSHSRHSRARLDKRDGSRPKPEPSKRRPRILHAGLAEPRGKLRAPLLVLRPSSHGDLREALSIAVSRSRPVSAFATGTASFRLGGGALAGVQAPAAFGLPAHGSALTLVPAGGGPRRLSPCPGIGRARKRIGTADRTRLTGVPGGIPTPGRGSGSGRQSAAARA